jgi:hypothetical protein
VPVTSSGGGFEHLVADARDDDRERGLLCRPVRTRGADRITRRLTFRQRGKVYGDPSRVSTLMPKTQRWNQQRVTGRAVIFSTIFSLRLEQGLREKLESKVTQGAGDAQLDDLRDRADAALRVDHRDHGPL